MPPIKIFFASATACILTICAVILGSLRALSSTGSSSWMKHADHGVFFCENNPEDFGTIWKLSGVPKRFLLESTVKSTS